MHIKNSVTPNSPIIDIDVDTKLAATTINEKLKQEVTIERLREAQEEFLSLLREAQKDAPSRTTDTVWEAQETTPLNIILNTQKLDKSTFEKVKTSDTNESHDTLKEDAKQEKTDTISPTPSEKPNPEENDYTSEQLENVKRIERTERVKRIERVEGE